MIDLSPVEQRLRNAANFPYKEILNANCQWGHSGRRACSRGLLVPVAAPRSAEPPSETCVPDCAKLRIVRSATMPSATALQRPGHCLTACLTAPVAQMLAPHTEIVSLSPDKKVHKLTCLLSSIQVTLPCAQEIL